MSDMDFDHEDEREDTLDDGNNEIVYASLDQALETHRIPLENRQLIRRAVAAAGVVRYTGTSSYIRAHREDDGPILRIRYGYTTGFISREEAESVGEHAAAWPSARADLWGVTHPVNNIGARGTESRRVERDYGTCPDCTMKYRPNGTCGCL